MSDDLKTPAWHIVPMREFPNLSVIRDGDGNIVATVQKDVQLIKNAPELYATSREVLNRLIQSQPSYDPNSLLGQLKSIILRIESSSKDEKV